jgi:ribosome modulation factor
MRSKEEQKVFHEGYDAFMIECLCEDDCPYPNEQPLLKDAWLEGWLEAQGRYYSISDEWE